MPEFIPRKGPVPRLLAIVLAGGEGRRLWPLTADRAKPAVPMAGRYRLISIIKMRESGYDAAIREFRITDRGIDVAPTFTSAQAILTGVARPAATVISTPPFAAEPARAQGGQP